MISDDIFRINDELAQQIILYVSFQRNIIVSLFHKMIKT